MAHGEVTQPRDPQQGQDGRREIVSHLAVKSKNRLQFAVVEG